MTADRPRTVLVVENGSLSTHVIMRRVRESGHTPLVVECTALEPPGPDVIALILTGTDVPAPSSLYDDEVELIRSCELPLLGICGGLHLIGRAYGCSIEEGEPVVGRSDVDLDPSVPIFAGLPARVTLFQRHRWMLAGRPDECEVIASSAGCPVEGVRHRSRPTYGMQAHLEFRPEGRAILRSFLGLAARAAGERPAR